MKQKNSHMKIAFKSWNWCWWLNYCIFMSPTEVEKINKHDQSWRHNFDNYLITKWRISPRKPQPLYFRSLLLLWERNYKYENVVESKSNCFIFSRQFSFFYFSSHITCCSIFNFGLRISKGLAIFCESGKE